MAEKKVLRSQNAYLKHGNKNLVSGEKGVSIELALQNGKHTFVSREMEIGQLPGGEPINAEISICYKYMEEDGAVILCGSEYSGRENNSITLKDGKTGNVLAVCSNDRTADSVFDLSENHSGQELAEAAREMLNEISENLITYAEEQGLMAFVRKDWKLDTLNTEELEEFRSLGLAYKDGKFQELYYPGKKYGEEYEIVPITSISGGVVPVQAGTAFFNVIGSDGDTPRGIPGVSSWIRFWEHVTGMRQAGCESHIAGWCNTSIYGGHIVFHQNQQHVVRGSNHIAAILPICGRHNSNPNMQMNAIRNTTAVWLDNYHN